MKKYEVILFDLDDTLIDNLENVRYAYRKMVEFMDEKYTEEGFQKWYNLDKQFWIDFSNQQIEVPLEYRSNHDDFVKYVRSLRYVLYFDNKIPLEKAFEINELFLESLNELVIPVEGAKEILEYLHSNYRLVVATNGPTSAVESKLKKIDCLDFIDSIFSADMTKNTVTKPDIKYFDELLEFIHFQDKEKLLIVGDSLRSEVQGGMNSGIDSVWFNRLQEKLPSQYKPTYIIEDLIDLKNIIENVQK